VILVDSLKAREAEGRPIRVGLVGAGFIARALASQIVNSVPGMRLAAVQGRRLDRAEAICRYAGADGRVADDQATLEDAIRSGRTGIVEDAMLLCRSEQLDVLVDATGSVDFGAEVALEAFRHGIHVVLMNAELDATIGPILHHYAREHGVILSATDGDEPGVQMNLARWLAGLGFTPRVLGNVKGFYDPYRNPSTQREFAERWGQNPDMVASFADGSKLNYEQAIVANATGFTVLSRGMSRGRRYEGPIAEIGALYDLDLVREHGGIVDFTVGTPGAKVFCLAEHDDSRQYRYLELYKLGSGPLYAFWVPYHLPHLETPNAIARVVLFGDSIAPPLGGPVVEVCAVAKRDLRAGETLDDCGTYMTYGEAVKTPEMCARRYLPGGLAQGCVLLRDIPKDAVLTYDDVELPPVRLADRLRAEQYRHFLGETWLEDRLAQRAAGTSIAGRLQGSPTPADESRVASVSPSSNVSGSP
jgi:predicted homoserine dehydrogenase-like protein